MRRAAGRIVETLRLHGHKAYFAGGWVRDYLLHRKPEDIDIATSALPEEVLRLFPKSRSLGAHFGVIQVRMYGHEYEVATFRRDHDYIDGRHPSTVTFSGPEEDSARRDFTINGLFYDPLENRLIDYVHGEDDLRGERIRTIGDPRQRFSEDKLRMLRAIRFSCSLKFRIVPETWEAIRLLASDILQVSWERIRDELTKILTGPDPGMGLDLLEKSSLLQYLLPEIASLRGIPESAEPGTDLFEHARITVASLHAPSMILAMGALLHHADRSIHNSSEAIKTQDSPSTLASIISERVCRRLRMSNEEIYQISDLVSLSESFKDPEEMQKISLMRLLRKPNIDDHLELLRAHLLSRRRNLAPYSRWLQKLEEFRQTPVATPLINGDDLVELGYIPGPLFKEILQKIEDLQCEGIIKSRKDALHHILAHYPLTNKPKA